MILTEPTKPALMACVATYIGGYHTPRGTGIADIFGCIVSL